MADLQTLFVKLSARFAGLSYGQLDQGIEQTIAELGEHTGADRVYVFIIRSQLMYNTHEWCAAEISPQKDNLQARPLETIEPWLKLFSQSQAVTIPRVADLPPERQREREILQAQDIQSLLAAPMSGTLGLLGFLGFDSVRRERSWQQDEVVLLQATANLIAGALERKAASEAHDAVQERLHKLAALVPGMLYQFQRYPDGRSRFPYASEGIEQIYGLPAQALADDATPVLEVIHPDDREMVVASIERSFAELSLWELDFRVRRRDGQVRWLHGQARPEVQADGSVMWHGYITDITERRAVLEALRHSEANLRALFDNTQDALLLIDRDYRLIAFNREAQQRMVRVLGITPYIGLDIGRAFAEHDPTVPRDLERGLSGETLRVERLTTRLDGSQYWVDVSINPVCDDTGQVLAVTFRSTDITGRKEMEEALRLGEARLRQVMEVTPDAVMLVDARGKISFVNPSTKAVLGYPPEALLGRSYLRLVHPEERRRVTAEVARAAASASKQSLVFRALHADGRELWLETSGATLTDAKGRVVGAVLSSRDVTERHRAEQALRREVRLRHELLELTNELLGEELGEGFYQRLLGRALELVPGAQAGSLLMLDPDGLYRFKAAIGYDLAMLQTLSLSEAELGRRDLDGPELVRYQHQSLAPDKLKVLVEGGRIREIQTTLSSPISVAGEVCGFFNLDNFERPDAFGPEAIEVVQALAAQAAIALQRLRLEAQLKSESARYEHLATHDALTGLPNRRLFGDRLEQALARAQRRKCVVALLFFDLDGFKEVNDTLGHDAGDLLLQLIARRLLGVIRAEDTLARLGGDEFAVILNELTHASDSEQVVGKLLQALEQPFELAGRPVQISASFGISLYPRDATTTSELLKRADLALYRIKGQSKRGYAFFSPEPGS
jgi:diguanylate cyclase (GGDEF)-like protein/PAS domain S-box-containing protein